MEHIKVPLKLRDDEPRIDGADGLLFMYTEDYDDGEITELITACNEYDTLKARSGLLSEAVDAIKAFTSGITNNNPDAGDEIHAAFILGTALLSKAKELLP